MARRLVESLGKDVASYISFDSYYRDLSELTIEERAAVNFDHPDSLDVDLLVAHLEALRGGIEVAVPIYDFATHTRSGDIQIVEATDFIVIEGILLFAFEEVRNQLDYLIFRDCPEDIRAQRRFKRDVRDRGRTPESVREQWATTVQPMHEIYVQPFAEFAHRVTTHGVEELDDVLPDIAEAVRRGEPLSAPS